MSDRYSLRIYDTELMRFSLSRRDLEGLVAEDISVNREYSHLMPLDMDPAGTDVVQWLRRRILPKNRTFADEILKTLGLSHNDTKGIIDACEGLSLNDSYWVVPEGFDGSFSRYNLYENRFSEALSLVAYTGIGKSPGVFTTSPELTTNGMLPKAWRFIEGEGIYLYKGGSAGASNTGREPYCEYYASQVAGRMGLDAVRYDLENWKGITASKCALFTDKDTSYVAAGRIVRTGGLKRCLDFYDSLGPVFGRQIRGMLVFDALIYNEDRHFGNFGVLRDNKSGGIVSPAPVFDNGLSLLCFAGREDLADYRALSGYAQTRTTPYGLSFEEVCAGVMGEEQKEMLRRVRGFAFTRHPELNLPEEHLRILERLLNERVERLLEIPSVSGGA